MLIRNELERRTHTCLRRPDAPCVHSVIGVCGLGCLVYLWFCAITRRRDKWLTVATGVLIGEGMALIVAKGCPLGVVQRRVGDNVPMFEL
jgi:hypothetical protein